jgi:polyhydroxybutyrate depolymerase
VDVRRGWCGCDSVAVLAPRAAARVRAAAPARAAAYACAALLLAAFIGACGGDHDGARATTHAAPRETGSCVDRLPLDTLLDGVAGRQPRPLILALHGARQGGYGMQRYTGLSDDAGGFLVAYPTTPHDNGFWQVGDVPQLLALVDAIDRCAPVATVTAIGFSNGGLMANALACRAADRVRAIVLVASGYEGLGRCAPERPVSVLDIHGTSDRVVGYRGLRAFVAGWARRDGCAPEPSARREPERVTHLRWHGCAGDSRVEHLRVAGDTHGWPSLVDANGTMVAFLRSAI